MITIDKSEIIQSRNELPSEVETLDEAREALQKGEKGKAIKIYKRAIKNGSVYAPNLLAELYFNENGRFSKKKILDLMILACHQLQCIHCFCIHRFVTFCISFCLFK